MNDILTSEVLDLAADEIQRQGWRKGDAGWDGRDGGLCIEGAIAAAAGIDTSFTDFSNGPFGGLWTCPAYKAVAEFLNMDVAFGHRSVDGTYVHSPKEPLWKYNDSIATDENEVIAVLRAAAAVERAKEAVAGYDKEDQELPLDVAA